MKIIDFIMRRFVIFYCAILVGVVTGPTLLSALTPTQFIVLMSGRGGLYGGETVNCNYTNGSFFGSCGFTFTRATTKFCQKLDGDWIQVASGFPCITNKGYLAETASTNNALWARDWTNAAWVKVNATTALNATGIDCTLNSATTVTATAGLATVIQTIALGLSTDTFSVFIKCVTCTGAISITADSVTYTDISAQLNTSTFTRVSVTQAALLNPAFGLRITNSGDSVIVDFGQLEVKGWPTSPIWSLGVALTRNLDNAILSTPPVIAGAYSALIKASPISPITNAANQIGLTISDGNGGTNRTQQFRVGTTAVPRLISTAAAANTTVNTAAVWAQNTSSKFVISTAAGAQQAAFSNSVVATGAGNLPTGINLVSIAQNQGATQQFDGYIEQIVIWPFALSATQVKQFSAP